MKFMFPGISVPLEVPAGYQVKAFGLHNDLRAFSETRGQLRYFADSYWAALHTSALAKDSFKFPQTVVLEESTGPNLAYFPGIDIPLEVSEGYRIAAVGMHDDLKAFANIDGQLHWFLKIINRWVQGSSTSMLKDKCDFYPHTIILEKIKMETSSITLPEPPEGFEVLAIGTHGALHKRRREPEFQKASYQFSTDGHRWTYIFHGYGSTLPRDPEDLTILYRKTPIKELTLGDIQDGDVFRTITETLLGQHAGTKFMRYYDHLVVIGKEGGCGSTDWFTYASLERKTSIKVIKE